MAVRTQFRGGASAVWGALNVSADAQGFGKVQNIGRKHGAEKVKLPDEEGITCGVVWFDETANLPIKVMCKANMVNPVIGDTLTCDGIKAYIDDWNIDWEHKGVKMLSMTLERYVDGGLPA